MDGDLDDLIDALGDGRPGRSPRGRRRRRLTCPGRRAGSRSRRPGRCCARATDRLAAAGSETPRLDAELLLGHAVGAGRTAVVAHPEAPVGADAARRVPRRSRAAGGRRAGRLPARDQGVLRPRLRGRRARADPAARDRAPRRARRGRGHAAARVGARPHGSRRPAGRGRRARGAARSRSRSPSRCGGSSALDAVEILAVGHLARRARPRPGERGRARRRGPDRVRRGGPAAGRCAAAPFDLVLANLPYVRHDAMAGLPVATSFEPALALDGGADGLEVIGRLLDRLPDALADDGVALLEIGADQGEAIVALVAATAARLVVRGRARPGRAAARRPDRAARPARRAPKRLSRPSGIIRACPSSRRPTRSCPSA